MALSPEEKIFIQDFIRPLFQHPEVKKMCSYTQHGDTTCLKHCLTVAYASYSLAKRLHLHVDEQSLIRGALLHDFFLYDWHDKKSHPRFHGFRHPGIALNNAKQHFKLTPIEQDIIAHHMWPLTLNPPRTKEGLIVCLMDKWCSIKETIKRPSFKRFMAKFHSFYK